MSNSAWGAEDQPPLADEETNEIDGSLFVDVVPSSPSHVRIVLSAAELMQQDDDEVDDDDEQLTRRASLSESQDLSSGSFSGSADATTMLREDEQQEVARVPVLLEGDYFPELPREMLDILEAMDAAPDDDYQQQEKERGALTAVTLTVPTDHLTSAHLGESEDRVATSATPASSSLGGQLDSTASTATPNEEVTPSSSSSSATTLAVLSQSPLAAHKPQQPRKRLRWSDEGPTPRSVVHHATVFIIPGRSDPATVATASMSLEGMRGSTSSGQNGALSSSNSAGPTDVLSIFRPTLNSDRSTYYAARNLRPSARFTAWQSSGSALRVPPELVEAVRLDPADAAGGDMLPTPPSPLSWDMLLRPPSSASAATLYSALFPNRPPLAGHCLPPLAPHQRFETAFRSFHFASPSAPSPRETLDEGGLVLPRMWIPNAIGSSIIEDVRQVQRLDSPLRIPAAPK